MNRFVTVTGSDFILVQFFTKYIYGSIHSFLFVRYRHFSFPIDFLIHFFCLILRSIFYRGCINWMHMKTYVCIYVYVVSSYVIYVYIYILRTISSQSHFLLQGSIVSSMTYIPRKKHYFSRRTFIRFSAPSPKLSKKQNCGTYEEARKYSKRIFEITFWCAFSKQFGNIRMDFFE